MWKKYVAQVLTELNEIQKLPATGILSGGALANKLWEKVNGTPAVVNDIDIFIFKSIKEIDTNFLKSMSVQSQDDSSERKKHFTTAVDEDVQVKGDNDGYHMYLNYCTTTKAYYRVLNTDRNDLLNFVDVEANMEDPHVIINSFDLNCVQVAYDLETGKLYYTPAFERFMQTGCIQITNANTPSHTLLRLLSKRDAMNAKFDKKRELTYIGSIHTHYLKKNIRFYFSDKYMDAYHKYKMELRNFGFVLETQATKNHSGYSADMPDNIYALRPKSMWFGADADEYTDFTTPRNTAPWEYNKHDKYLTSLYALNYYFRCVYGTPLVAVWERMGNYMLMGDNYFEGYTTEEVVSMGTVFDSIEKWTKRYPMMEKTLFGLTLKEKLQSLKYLKLFLLENKDKAELLEILGQRMAFESVEDVREYFMLMQIKYRKSIARFKDRKSKNYQRNPF
jgi:hypothetical protein